MLDRGDPVKRIEQAIVYVDGMIADAEEGFFSIDDLRDLLEGLFEIQRIQGKQMSARSSTRSIRMDGPSSISNRDRAGSRFKKKRKASAWNKFVADEMPRVLKQHPRFTPQRAMKEVSARWARSSKNPNKGKKKRGGRR